MLSLTTYMLRENRGSSRPVGQSVSTEGGNPLHVLTLHTLKVDALRVQGYVTQEEWQDEHPKFYTKSRDERTWHKGWRNDWERNAVRDVHKNAGRK